MELSIVIVNWNVKDYLEKCLDSLIFTNLPQISSNKFEIFVVDNASIDGSAEMVQKKFSWVKLIVNKENIGFAKANNQAIKQAKGEFVLLLNPDIEFLVHHKTDKSSVFHGDYSTKGSADLRGFQRRFTRKNLVCDSNILEKMVNFMRTHSDCGIAGCKLLNPDGTLQPSVRRFPTLLSQIITLTKAPNIFPWLVKRYTGLDIDYEKTQEVDQIMGAFFMIRKKVIDQIGLLDENFWAWFEEVDYCKRAKDAGWKIYYYPEVEIIHHKGQSFSQLTCLVRNLIKNEKFGFFNSVFNNLKNYFFASNISNGVNRQKRFNKSLLYYFKKHHSFLSWFVLWLMQPLSLFLTWLDETIGIKRRLGKKKYL